MLLLWGVFSLICVLLVWELISFFLFRGWSLEADLQNGTVLHSE